MAQRIFTENIDGIQVQLNFNPFDTQKEYMKKVIESVREGKHAVLESPTG